MGKTKIEWCDFTVNPIRATGISTGAVGHYCEKISPGCKNCYASRLQKRFGTPEYSVGNGNKVSLFLDLKVLESVIRRRKPTVYFWCDMTDLFLEHHPDEWIDQCFATMALTPQHRHLVLTKRAERMPKVLSCGLGMISEIAQMIDRKRYADIAGRLTWPLPNVGLGVSVEDRKNKGRIDILRDVPAAMRFLSLEPLLEDLGELDLRGISWVILGGESGPGARPMHPDWARSVRDQCAAAGVPFFFKQWGHFRPIGCADWDSEDFDHEAVVTANTEATVRVWPDGAIDDGNDYADRRGAWFMEPVGKKVAGRLLDGLEWNDRPEGW